MTTEGYVREAILLRLVDDMRDTAAVRLAEGNSAAGGAWRHAADTLASTVGQFRQEITTGEG
jgi:hypothetical protein